MNSRKFRWTPTATWVLVGVISLIWWPISAQGCFRRFVLTVWLSFASMMIGALVGFLLSSYGKEESSNLGKIRDWLVGGITALTVAKAGALKSTLLLFVAGPGPMEFAYAVGAAVFYSGLGFFFMFFQRELILNILLAQSRAERGKLEGSQEAGQVIQRLLVRLPASVLTGVSAIGEVEDLNEKEQVQLRQLLYSPDVEKFLQEADDAASRGLLDWDIASKSAYIRYYRTYFESGANKELDKAIEWATRALNMNPLHVDLTMKYADLLFSDKDYFSGSAILEKLALREDAPVLVRQWLGFSLRYLPDRLDDAIKYSQQYLALFPEDSDPLFNIAYAYASKYCSFHINNIDDEYKRAELRRLALSNLENALKDQPKMAEQVRTSWTATGKGFECFLQDADFRELVGLPESFEPPTEKTSV